MTDTWQDPFARQRIDDYPLCQWTSLSRQYNSNKCSCDEAASYRFLVSLRLKGRLSHHRGGDQLHLSLNLVIRIAPTCLPERRQTRWLRLKTGTIRNPIELRGAPREPTEVTTWSVRKVLNGLPLGQAESRPRTALGAALRFSQPGTLWCRCDRPAKEAYRSSFGRHARNRKCCAQAGDSLPE